MQYETKINQLELVDKRYAEEYQVLLSLQTKASELNYILAMIKEKKQ